MILIKSSLEMYFCFCCVCVFGSMHVFTWGSDSLNEDAFMHTFRVDCFVMPLFKKCRLAPRVSKWIVLLEKGSAALMSRDLQGEIWAGLWGFLRRQQPPHKCECILPVERHCSSMKHLPKPWWLFVSTHFSKQLFFYLAVAIKDLPLLLFSLFHHLFHHLISLLFSFEVNLFIPMRICILYKKERFRCTPPFLIVFLWTFKNNL